MLLWGGLMLGSPIKCCETSKVSFAFGYAREYN